MSLVRRDIPNLRDHCEQACVMLWGNPSQRDRQELRWNGHDAYSAKTFSFKKKAWYDHGAGWGGGLLDLVAHAKGQPKQELKGQAFFDAWREAHAMGLAPDPPPEKKSNGAGGSILATYSYHDENGQLLFEVVRFDTANPHDRFRQRRPDGNGGWIWDVKGVRTHVLYRLPALIEAVRAGQRVLICEGEKDANAAVALGFVATTMPGGVNKWFAEYDEFFRSADLVIVADNDPQAKDSTTGAPQFHPNGRPVHIGQDHAAKLATRLRKVAAHVRVIIPPLKDLTAWREAGAARADLVAAIGAAPDMVKPSAPEERTAERGKPNGAGATPSESELPPFCDEALALRFAERHADDLRFVAEWGKWLRWDEKRWRPDRTIRAFDLARAVCREAAAEARSAKLASHVASAKTVAAVITLARADRRLAATSEQWDADPWLLNTPEGAVNLRTGETRPHRREDYCTKITNVGPRGDCPKFKAFLLKVMADDEARVAFLRRACGYCLTGDTSEQAIFFNYGGGMNGKSVLMETLAGILADYCIATPIETFTESRNDRHPTELARLRGTRLVTATETEAGRYWAESRLKELTGGERIPARFMHKDHFEYTPQFKPWISGNHRPRLRSVGKAMRRRVKMVPFNVTIADEQRDRDFAAKLKPEWPGILQLMIGGCLEWQKSGLAPPAAVEQATDAYFAAEDGYSDWIADRCETSGGFAAKSTQLFASWRDWADKAGQRAGDNKQFREEMERLGYPPKHTKKGNIFVGLRIRQDPPERDDPGRSATAAPELDLEQPGSTTPEVKAGEGSSGNRRITRARDAHAHAIRGFQFHPSPAFTAPEATSETEGVGRPSGAGTGAMPPGGRCAQCGKPADGREELCALPDEEVWLHPECQRAYVNRGALRGESPYTVLSLAPAGQRCSLCGGGSPRPMRIRRNGEVNVWHPDCAARFVAVVADTPPEPGQDGSGEGPSKGGG